ncbi:MAG: hypothetical protein PHU63_01640, partial [Candidatus ainarchaeum sp.]|nr:hypothetical protein [Candidatus ainarchaeum sp.]
MRVPILKKNDKFYIEIPKELVILDSLELFELKNGFYLLSVENLPERKKSSELKSRSTQSTQSTQEEEFDVISKLMSLQFSERTPSSVLKILNAKEKQILDDLISKKQVWLFNKSPKYSKEGVYNISDKLFSLWKDNKYNNKTNNKPASSFLPVLQREGFVIVSDSRDAHNFSEEIKEKMSIGQAFGVKGFDGKYYVASRAYYSKLSQ